MDKARILQAWREDDYRPAKNLKGTVALIEAGPFGAYIKMAVDQLPKLSSEDDKAIDKAAIHTIPAKEFPRGDWLVIIAAAFLCKPARFEGRDDSDYIRLRLTRYLTRWASYQEAEADTLPKAEAKSRSGRRGSVEPPPPPPPAPAESDPAPEVDEEEPSSGLTWH